MIPLWGEKWQNSSLFQIDNSNATAKKQYGPGT